MGALPMILSAICAGSKIRLQWGHFATASTDGRVIKMPYLPLEDDKVEAYALGYGIHETGHVEDTDFAVFAAGVGGNPFRHALVNVLEDVRIEGLRMEKLPGARRWLENLAYAMLKDGYIGPRPATCTNVADLLISYLLTHMWVEVLSFDGLRHAAVECRDALAKALPPEVFTEVEREALSVRNATSTRDVVAIADRIVLALTQKQQEAEQQAQQPPQPQQSERGADESPGGQGGDDGSSGASSAAKDDDDEPQGERAQESRGGQPESQGDEGDSEGDGAGGNSSDADGAQPAQQPSTEAGSGNAPEGNDGKDAGQGAEEGAQQGSQQGSGSGSGTEPESRDAGSRGKVDGSEEPDNHQFEDPRAVAQAIQEILDATEIESGKDLGDHIKQGLEQQMGDLRQAVARGEKAAPVEFAELTLAQMSGRGDPVLIAETRAQSIAIRAQMEDHIQARTQVRVVSARTGPRLLRDAASRRARGNPRLFGARRADAYTVATAIVLLVDASTSMDIGSRIELAKKAATALAVALDGIDGVQLSVIAFGTSPDPVTRVMQFGENIRSASGRIASLRAQGSTPMAEGLMVAHSDLLALPEPERRIVFTLSDGDPNDTGALLQVRDLGERLGIEHMGIGISSHMEHLFEQSRSISNVQELPRAVLAMAQEALLEYRMAA